MFLCVEKCVVLPSQKKIKKTYPHPHAWTDGWFWWRLVEQGTEDFQTILLLRANGGWCEHLAAQCTKIIFLTHVFYCDKPCVQLGASRLMNKELFTVLHFVPAPCSNVDQARLLRASWLSQTIMRLAQDAWIVPWSRHRTVRIIAIVANIAFVPFFAFSYK